MTQDRINSYQPGGLAYNTAVTLYGKANADYLATVALGGDEDALTNAIETVRKNGGVRETSTLSIFGNQIYNEPFNAPIEQGSKVATNTVTALGDAAKSVATNAVKNWGVWLLAFVIIAILFLYVGGAKVIRRKIA